MLKSVLQWNEHLQSERGRAELCCLYGVNAERQPTRYADALAAFIELFGEREVMIYTSPGRTEIGGNHTDHQHGCVVAASVTIDVLCVVSPTDKHRVRLHSKGHAPNIVDLSVLEPQSDESSNSTSIVRGVATWFAQNGYKVGGFDAYTTSDVLSGSGLSSSAAFEVAVGGIFNELYNDGSVSAIDIARAGQYAENVFYGKPSGLLDQMAASVGGVVTMDFENTAAPAITPIPFDLSSHGYALCVVNTGGSHADLTEHYAAIPQEMRAVAQCFGKTVLREVDEQTFRAELAQVRKSVGDRAVLRAMHFFDDNRRAVEQATALQRGDITAFLELVRRSGYSSEVQLQNIHCGGAAQGVALSLAVSRRLLDCVGGACRVHGGGFAGTIQAYVPLGEVERYKSSMESLLGEGCCQVLGVRPVGGYALAKED